MIGPHPARCLPAALLAALLVVGVMVAEPRPAQGLVDHRTVPTQFVAKLYSEAWGRAPEAAGWQLIVDNLHINGCTVAALKYWGIHFYTQPQFTGAYPLSAGGHVIGARIEALARGALNREPDAAFYSSLYSAMDSSPTEGTWTNIVNNVFNGPGFSALVTNDICPTGTEVDRKDPSTYWWNETAQEPLMGGRHHHPGTCGLGTGTTQTTLQDELNAAAGRTNKTVLLRQGAEIWIDGNNTGGTWPPIPGTGAGITIPAGVTLRTCGPTDPGGVGLPNPSVNAYALQGRLVRRWTRVGDSWDRDTTFYNSGSRQYSPMVRVDSGGRLENVWVDGGRNGRNNVCHTDGWCFNVFIMGGGATTWVSSNRLDNSGGVTVVHAGGSLDGVGRECTATHNITDNLVTGYGSRHHTYPTVSFSDGWLDGISTYCERTEIARNGVIDTTDVAIIVFRTCLKDESFCTNAAGTLVNRTQQSDVHDNVVVSAGNSVYAGIWLSPLDVRYDQTVIADYNGATVHHNHLWTGFNSIMDGLIMVGIRANKPVCYADLVPECGASFDANQTTRGTGASVTDNDMSGQIGYTEMAIGLSGMINVTITGNQTTGARVAGPGYGGLQTNFPPFSCKTTAAHTTAPLIYEYTDITGGFFGNGFWASGNTTGNSAPALDRDLIYVPPPPPGKPSGLPAGCITGVNLG